MKKRIVVVLILFVVSLLAVSCNLKDTNLNADKAMTERHRSTGNCQWCW